MTDPSPDVESTVRPRGRPVHPLSLTVLVGLLACAVAVVDGIVLVCHRVVVQCANGTFFPEGATDTNCYAHPRAGLGVGLIGLGVAAAAILVAVQLLFRAVREMRPRE